MANQKAEQSFDQEMMGLINLSDEGNKKQSIVEKELDLRNYVSGRVDTLRNTILTFLAERRFDIALKELSLYQSAKSVEPSYKQATEGLFDHCLSIIDAMKNIIDVKEIEMLPRSKRQEIYSRMKRLIENTKSVLIRLEQIENDLLVKDVKSVSWFLKSCVISVFVLISLAAFVDSNDLFGHPLDAIAMEISNSLWELFGL